MEFIKRLPIKDGTKPTLFGQTCSLESHSQPVSMIKIIIDVFIFYCVFQWRRQKLYFGWASENVSGPIVFH